MEKLLIFIDAADDAACYPLASFVGMTDAAHATIKMSFLPSFNPVGAADGDVDLVTVTCNADTELKVFKSIANAIAGGFHGKHSANGYVVVADDVNSEYVDANITGIAITLGA